MRHLPNLLSLLRLGCVPYLVLLANQEHEALFFGLVVAAWITDGLDGWLARRFAWVSRLGAVLDSVADITLIVAILYGIYRFHPLVFLDHGALLWAIVAVWSGVHLASLARYGRTSSFHTRLAQAGILLFAAFVVVLFTTGFVPALYYFAGSVCLLAGLENAAMVWALSEWQPDIPSLSGALRHRAERRKRGLPPRAANE